MSEAQLDQAKVDAFANRLADISNGAHLSLMISIGHQTSLFDVMSGLPPSTSQEIALAAGLQERYVREWLGAMTTGRIVDYEPVHGRYVLPPEYASMLTRAAGANNSASWMQVVAMLASVEQGIVHSFKHGGGVPYSAFPRFQEIFGASSAMGFDARLIDKTLPLVPGMIQTLGRGIEVLDVGCGQGHAINLMARAFPNSRLSGYDFSEQGIAAARAEAAAMGLTNARFEVRNAAALGEPDTYDFITAFDAIHDQAQPQIVLNQIAEALKPAGTFLMVDNKASSYLHENMDLPYAPTMYAGSTMHCMTVSLASGGEGLGSMWGKQRALEMLAKAGFQNVTIKETDSDTGNYYYIARKQ
jgi:2-polyprenyl-3-methyl-5-hydroxy-6-metoxy-1,4-benzoquinol methylase